MRYFVKNKTPLEILLAAGYVDTKISGYEKISEKNVRRRIRKSGWKRYHAHIEYTGDVIAVHRDETSGGKHVAKMAGFGLDKEIALFESIDTPA